MVQAEKIWLDWNPEMFSENGDTVTVLGARMCMPLITFVILGLQKRGKWTKNMGGDP